MAERLADPASRKRGEGQELSGGSILMAGLARSAKISALQEGLASSSAQRLNMDPQVSWWAPHPTERQRTLPDLRLSGENLAEASSKDVVPEFTAILFVTHRKQNAWDMLPKLSRNGAVVLPWNESIVDGEASYAIPDHLECRRYPIGGFLAASPEVEER
ncbi:BREX-3 system P-loop-containing protein BrxF [Methylacidimicrobium sp. B4]|uniref:BREX-3 system P-loop-containing protein BrxF n=1 Tax=Methylacidimicrobium sp. B4 TaxID=2796139 RepID=UPI001A8FE7E2|nr:BREX-3 system P-loop-containing protein BrxF [Methylacidimicrobium sp. B4]QSR84672.1 BREX-3 system P-loop-containing protein BrxF [Methylacidimicrobium sp. B4]